MANDKDIFDKLLFIREHTGKCLGNGLSDELLNTLFETRPLLVKAIEEGYRKFLRIQKEFPEEILLSEKELIPLLQTEILNFYGAESVCPFVPLVGRGPWIISVYGGVFYDTGGYGMLGFGHTKQVAGEVLSRNLVMANVMTSSFSQYRFTNILKEKIGYTRKKDRHPYSKYIAMNSGSEALTVATRITDAHAKVMTDPGAKHEGKRIVFISLAGSFHGRTERPAEVSNSTKKYYQQLASFRDRDNVLMVEPNDGKSLKECFQRVVDENLYVEAMFIEPVMGEGNPGLAITPEFYSEARRLTKEHDALLIIDSVQAGLRATGCLSIVDYPGFSELEAPDMEAFSKALNAGQFPLSTLALSSEAASSYRLGIYGNTMTGNPRALEIARAVLTQVDDKLIKNIREKGVEFVEKLKTLQAKFPNVITYVQGTGLLLSASINPQKFKVTGHGGLEEAMRLKGINVIHGGENSLRFTPQFKIDSEEIDLIITVIKDCITA